MTCNAHTHDYTLIHCRPWSKDKARRRTSQHYSKATVQMDRWTFPFPMFSFFVPLTIYSEPTDNVWRQDAFAFYSDNNGGSGQTRPKMLFTAGRNERETFSQNVMLLALPSVPYVEICLTLLLPNEPF